VAGCAGESRPPQTAPEPPGLAPAWIFHLGPLCCPAPTLLLLLPEASLDLRWGLILARAFSGTKSHGKCTGEQPSVRFSRGCERWGTRFLTSIGSVPRGTADAAGKGDAAGSAPAPADVQGEFRVGNVRKPLPSRAAPREAPRPWASCSRWNGAARGVTELLEVERSCSRCNGAARGSRAARGGAELLEV